MIEPPILPLGSYPDPLNDSRYYNQAGVIVQVTDNGSSDTVTILRPTGDGGATPCTSGSPANSEEKKLYDMFSASGVITTNQSFQDNREQSPVRITTLDISQITKKLWRAMEQDGKPL